jgi:hypothetical protein
LDLLPIIPLGTVIATNPERGEVLVIFSTIIAGGSVGWACDGKRFSIGTSEKVAGFMNG